MKQVIKTKRRYKIKQNILIVPGLGGSEAGHWQTFWEEQNPEFRRVEQKDWNLPICQDWVSEIERAVKKAGSDTILVAHSLGCLAVAHWAETTQQKIRGALLVAAPDPAGPLLMGRIFGFTPFPKNILPFPSIVVSSSSDPFAPLSYSEGLASSWGSQFVNLGELGHINTASRLGEWPQGLQLLNQLSKSISSNKE